MRGVRDADSPETNQATVRAAQVRKEKAAGLSGRNSIRGSMRPPQAVLGLLGPGLDQHLEGSKGYTKLMGHEMS